MEAQTLPSPSFADGNRQDTNAPVVPDVDRTVPDQASHSDTTGSGSESPAIDTSAKLSTRSRPFSPSFSYPSKDAAGPYNHSTQLLSPTLENEGAETQLQFIDEDQNFTSELQYYMQQVWGLADAGFDYNLVAVFGSQSTGKSTLLNGLFGTKFAVMSEKARAQTTKGIWMSQARTQGMKMLIMDVEGTDGRERGEDQDFERKSALFSLATAEVLLVNMWENMVGLYNGANMGLLKTVFEVNLQIFHDRSSRKGKTLLFFIIRDHVSKTSLANLSDTLRRDLDRIWSELSKPEGLESCTIDDFFDFTFTSLPHKLLQPENFSDQVAQLRQRFVNRRNPQYVFQSQYHKMIPADGFPKYAAAIWEKIVTNRDLDLPTQQQLLAQYRCDEIANAVFDAFIDAIRPLRPLLESGQVVEHLGHQMDDHRQTALAHFDKNASRYHQDVYTRKRKEHLAKLNGELHILFLAQLKNLAKQNVQRFRETLKRALQATSELDLSVVIDRATTEALSQFNEAAQQVVLDDTDWGYTQEAEELAQELNQITDQLKEDALNRLLRRLEKSLQSKYADVIPGLLNDPKEETMWSGVMCQFFLITEHEEKTLDKAVRGLGLPSEELDQLLRRFHLASWETLGQRIREETSEQMMLVRLRTCLEDRFRYDDQGIPRVWQPTDDIDGHFATAKEHVVRLIPLFSRLNPGDDLMDEYFPTDYDLSESLEIFSSGRQRDVINRFKREADAMYLEAKRSVVATTARTPYWVIIMLIMLGWNEFVTVITSPIYLILLITFGTVGYVIHLLNLTGPLQRALQVALAGVSRHVHNLLLEAVNRTDPARPVANSPYIQGGSSGDSIELDKMRPRRAFTTPSDTEGSSTSTPSVPTSSTFTSSSPTIAPPQFAGDR
ncbi:Dynamin-like GTPase that mediates homotypic ER fusion [Dispira simplex]|nr:Dynamin-like GTPase that mediates homotypic ER fusion [Dispira simplex]